MTAEQRRIELHVKLKGIAHAFWVALDHERTFVIRWWRRTFIFHHQEDDGALIYFEESCYDLLDPQTGKELR
jgi:hypothetical protein